MAAALSHITLRELTALHRLKEGHEAESNLLCKSLFTGMKTYPFIYSYYVVSLLLKLLRGAMRALCSLLLHLKTSRC